MKLGSYDSEPAEDLRVDAVKCRPFLALNVEFKDHVMAIPELVFFNDAAQGSSFGAIGSGPGYFPENEIGMLNGRTIDRRVVLEHPEPPLGKILVKGDIPADADRNHPIHAVEILVDHISAISQGADPDFWYRRIMLAKH